MKSQNSCRMWHFHQLVFKSNQQWEVSVASLLSVWVCGREESVKAGTHAAREEGGNSGQSPSEPAGRKDHVLSLNLSFPISNRDPLGLKLIFMPCKLCAFTYSLQILLWGQCAMKSASRLKRISWKKVAHRGNLHELIFNIETTRKTQRSSWTYL